MSFVRAFKKTLKDGTVQTYYGRVETYREGGMVKQKMIEYLGTNPNVRNFPLDPPLARKVAPLLAEELSPTDMMRKLQDLGFDVPFRPHLVHLRNNPPLRKVALRIE